MRIGVSLHNFRAGCMGGVETYYRKIVEYLPAIARSQQCELVFFGNRTQRELVSEALDAYIEVGGGAFTTKVARLTEAFSFWNDMALNCAIRDAHVDVMFYPHQAVFPKKCCVPSVVTAHDVQHLVYPRYFSLLDRGFRATAWRRGVLRAEHIIAISQATAASIEDAYAISPNRITVVHHGYESCHLEPSREVSLVGHDPYYFYPAASYPHKGHLTLVRSYATLRRVGKCPAKIMFCGMKTSYWRKIQAEIDRLGLAGDIFHAGFLPYKEVLQLYSGASAILFPTEFEGFGIPVLEAAQFGKKIICSKLSVFDELGVPDAYQIDFNDVGQLQNALASQAEFALRKKPDTWADVMGQTFEVLLAVAGNNKRGVE